MTVLFHRTRSESIENELNTLTEATKFVCYTSYLKNYNFFSKKLQNMQSLCLRFTNLNNTDCQNICQNCPNLMEFDIVGNDINNYSSISKKTQLRSFKAETLNLEISIEEIFKLSTLKNLEVLMIHHQKLKPNQNEHVWKKFSEYKFSFLKYFVFCPLVDTYNYRQSIK